MDLNSCFRNMFFLRHRDPPKQSSQTQKTCLTKKFWVQKKRPKCHLDEDAHPSSQPIINPLCIHHQGWSQNEGQQHWVYAQKLHFCIFFQCISRVNTQNFPPIRPCPHWCDGWSVASPLPSVMNKISLSSKERIHIIDSRVFWEGICDPSQQGTRWILADEIEYLQHTKIMGWKWLYIYIWSQAPPGPTFCRA